MYRFSGKPIYLLPDITGKTAWVDYLPVKGTGETSDKERYDSDGHFDSTEVLSSVTGLVEWVDYIPAYTSVLTLAWSTDGYIPYDEITESQLLMETGDALLLETGDILLL